MGTMAFGYITLDVRSVLITSKGYDINGHLIDTYLRYWKQSPMNQHGFELIKEAYIAEIDSNVQYYRHSKTGAEVISCNNDDENKSFAVVFKTPPPDSTGLPHILEHSVLCGSRKYPVKDPFVNLIRTSLSTFINAMTFPDMTMYPVASPNKQDFYNLIDVYLDAAFHPLITEETFKQEGWHIETGEEGFELQGVVFNEMKGYYSSADVILDETIRASLLPDTPYAYSYGGDPLVIPELTYEQFKNFHATYYHPSNARFFFYGDDATEERLAYLGAFLDEFDHLDINSELPLQEKFDAPRTVTQYYDAGDEADENKGYVTVGWLMDDVTNHEANIALEILDHILLGTSASPLRKALIESGLGEDISGEGFDRYSRQATFTVGLKGADLTRKQEIQDLIQHTLQSLADDGLSPETVQASLNTVEFTLRERNSGRFPRGLTTMISMMPTWMHGGDPVESLAFDEALQNIKTHYENDTDFFSNLIGKYLINNTHRVTITLEPKDGVNAKREQEERTWVETNTKDYDDEARKVIEEEARQLKIMQETPDDPEQVAKIPTLGIEDIDRNIKTTPTEVLEYKGAKVLYHDLPTSGIAYVDVAFDLKAIPQRLIPYLSLYAEALTEIGTTKQDFVALSQRIGTNTGGLGASVITSKRVDADESVTYLFLRGKAMFDQVSELVAIMQDILLSLQLDNQERIKQMILESKASRESTLGLRGHVNANLRLRAHFDDAGWIDEQMGGVSQLQFVRDLAKRIDSDWASILTDLQALHNHLIQQNGMVINATLNADAWQPVYAELQGLVDNLPVGKDIQSDWERPALPDAEAFSVATQVNFVGKGANLYELGYKLQGSYAVILKHMNLDYMWTKVRVQGGAYGGGCYFNPISGVATFLSWQDPNLVDTLAVYDNAANYLRELQMSEGDIEKAIIGAIADLDSYLLPDAKGFQATMRNLVGTTDERRQQIRDEVLNTTLADFHAFADVLARVAQSGKVAITGASDKITNANKSLGNSLQVTKLQ
jgi:Zn-dependent M16 (insulinase) family peptidase